MIVKTLADLELEYGDCVSGGYGCAERFDQAMTAAYRVGYVEGVAAICGGTGMAEAIRSRLACPGCGAQGEPKREGDEPWCDDAAACEKRQ